MKAWEVSNSCEPEKVTFTEVEVKPAKPDEVRIRNHPAALKLLRPFKSRQRISQNSHRPLLECSFEDLSKSHIRVDNDRMTYMQVGKVDPVLALWVQ